jgi:hypothetical protein
VAAKETATPVKAAQTPPEKAEPAKPVVSAAKSPANVERAKAAPKDEDAPVGLLNLPVAQAMSGTPTQTTAAKAPAKPPAPLPQPAPLPSLAEQAMAATRNAAPAPRPTPAPSLSDEAKAKEAADLSKTVKELEARRAQDAARARRAFNNSLYGIPSP